MRPSALAVCLLAAALIAPLTASTTTESTLSAKLREVDGRFQLSGDVVGGLQGRLTLDLGAGPGSMAGHTWRLEVQRQDGAGTWYEAGVLMGTVATGTLTPADDGQSMAGDVIALEISAGDGELGDVAAGSGELRLTVHAGETPTASGTLTLTY
jgi:hypothetical protein